MSRSAHNQVIPLYDGPAPGSETWTRQEAENHDEIWDTRVIYNVSSPTLTVMRPAASPATGTGVIICPGGGFHALSIDREGLDVARWLNDKGVTCFVLKYRLVQCKTDDPVTELTAKAENLGEAIAPVVPLAMADGLTAVRHVRQRARQYGIQPNRIGIIGFSAGGTVAASVAYHYTAETRPDFVAPIYLAYEWVSKTAVPADAPPLFLLAATDDALGLAADSLALYQDWTRAHKSTELHLFAQGGHGFGMGRQNLPTDRWIERFAEWMEAQGFLS